MKRKGKIEGIKKRSKEKRVEKRTGKRQRG